MKKTMMISALAILLAGAPLTTFAATVPSVSSIEHTISADLLNQDPAITVTEPTVSQAEATNIFNAASWMSMMNQMTVRTTITELTPLSKNTSNVTYYVFYRETPQQQKAVAAGVKQVLKRIIEPGMNQVAKEQAINEYIVSHVKYDTSLTLGTAYDALYKHHAVCNGYAWLAYDMLTAAGIQNRVVVGTAHYGSQSGEHAWNEVDVNGKWFMLDTTWDTSLPDHYRFFNLTSAQLSKTHTWNHAGLPIADTNFVSMLEHSHSKQDLAILKAIVK